MFGLVLYHVHGIRYQINKIFFHQSLDAYSMISTARRLSLGTGNSIHTIEPIDRGVFLFPEINELDRSRLGCAGGVLVSPRCSVYTSADGPGRPKHEASLCVHVCSMPKSPWRAIRSMEPKIMLGRDARWGLWELKYARTRCNWWARNLISPWSWSN